MMNGENKWSTNSDLRQRKRQAIRDTMLSIFRSAYSSDVTDTMAKEIADICADDILPMFCDAVNRKRSLRCEVESVNDSASEDSVVNRKGHKREQNYSKNGKADDSDIYSYGNDRLSGQSSFSNFDDEESVCGLLYTKRKCGSDMEDKCNKTYKHKRSRSYDKKFSVDYYPLSEPSVKSRRRSRSKSDEKMKELIDEIMAGIKHFKQAKALLYKQKRGRSSDTGAKRKYNVRPKTRQYQEADVRFENAVVTESFTQSARYKDRTTTAESIIAECKGELQECITNVVRRTLDRRSFSPARGFDTSTGPQKVAACGVACCISQSEQCADNATNFERRTRTNSAERGENIGDGQGRPNPLGATQSAIFEACKDMISKILNQGSINQSQFASVNAQRISNVSNPPPISAPTYPAPPRYAAPPRYSSPPKYNGTQEPVKYNRASPAPAKPHRQSTQKNTTVNFEYDGNEMDDGALMEFTEDAREGGLNSDEVDDIVRSIKRCMDKRPRSKVEKETARSRRRGKPFRECHRSLEYTKTFVEDNKPPKKHGNAPQVEPVQNQTPKTYTRSTSMSISPKTCEYTAMGYKLPISTTHAGTQTFSDICDTGKIVKYEVVNGNVYEVEEQARISKVGNGNFMVDARSVYCQTDARGKDIGIEGNATTNIVHQSCVANCSQPLNSRENLSYEYSKKVDVHPAYPDAMKNMIAQDDRKSRPLNRKIEKRSTITSEVSAKSGKYSKVDMNEPLEAAYAVTDTNSGKSVTSAVNRGSIGSEKTYTSVRSRPTAHSSKNELDGLKADDDIEEIIETNFKPSIDSHEENTEETQKTDQKESRSLNGNNLAVELNVTVVKPGKSKQIETVTMQADTAGRQTVNRTSGQIDKKEKDEDFYDFDF